MFGSRHHVTMIYVVIGLYNPPFSWLGTGSKRMKILGIALAEFIFDKED